MESDAQRNALLKLVQREEGMEWADERTGWKNDQTSGKFISSWIFAVTATVSSHILCC